VTKPRLAVLTPAQRRVLGELVKDGASNPEIARRLGVSLDTVKSHMKVILAVTGCGDRAAVVADCLRGRLVIRTVRRPWELTGRAQMARYQKEPTPINHGTHGGFVQHYYRGEPYCDDCRRANSEHMAAIRPGRNAS
jgi:DNA-binding CsgD family transcriptional regulator